MNDGKWQVQEAKSRFSQLVDEAINNKPQIVTRHGNDAVIVISVEDYKKLIRPEKDLVTFLQTSPLAGIELDVSRNQDIPRDMEL